MFGLPQKWLAIGAAGAIVLALLITQTMRLGSAQERVGELEAAVAQAVDANEQNQIAIDGLVKEITELLLQITVDENAMAAASAQNRLDRERLKRERDQAEKERDELFDSTPSCQELARMDLGMCPGVVDRLRQLARDLDKD